MRRQYVRHNTLKNVREKAKEKLLLLERCIERRYLKPPLRKNLELTVHNVYQMTHENHVSINGGDCETNDNHSSHSGKNATSPSNGKSSSGSKNTNDDGNAANEEDEEDELEEGETRGLRKWRNGVMQPLLPNQSHKLDFASIN